MKRVFGAVSGALRSLAPKANAPAIPSAAHQERVRKAMEALAPVGRRLPSESKALAMELAASAGPGGTDISAKTPEEMYLAASALSLGKHVPQDKAAAFDLWKKAADAGHPKAKYSYAACLREGYGPAERDVATAASLFERLGDEGLLEAKNALAVILSTGEGEDVGVPQDEKRALELFKEAAIGGFVPAIHAAASMMEAGKGGEKDGAKATQWLETAIEAGNPVAHSMLATWYTAGRAGLEVDHRRAFELHLKAANMGMARAMYNTAVHYFEGTGVEQNLPEAAVWFEKAGAAGVPQALLNLGKMLETGLGVEVDRKRALELYQTALRAEGQLEGELAEMGDDVMAKLVEAKEKGAFADKGKGNLTETGITQTPSKDNNGEPSYTRFTPTAAAASAEMSMSGCPMARVPEVAGIVLAVVFFTKACKAFAAASAGSNAAVPGRKHKVPDELSKCEGALLERLQLATDVALQAGAAMKAVINLKKEGIVLKGATDLVTETDKANEKLIFDAVRSSFPEDQLIGEESSADAGSIAALTDAPTWIVDPVDGTTNFVHGFPMTCVSIGFGRGSKIEVGVVYDPCADELYQTVRGFGAFVNGQRASSSGCTELGNAVVITEYGYQRDPVAVRTMMDVTEKVLRKCRGLRQVGSGCLDLCWVGCGRVDAVYSGVAGEGWQPWDYAAGWLFIEEAGGVVTQVDGSPFHVFSKSVLCAASPQLADELVSTIR
eukprot:g8181.t1